MCQSIWYEFAHSPSGRRLMDSGGLLHNQLSTEDDCEHQGVSVPTLDSSDWKWLDFHGYYLLDGLGHCPMDSFCIE